MNDVLELYRKTKSYTRFAIVISKYTFIFSVAINALVVLEKARIFQ